MLAINHGGYTGAAWVGTALLAMSIPALAALDQWTGVIVVLPFLAASVGLLVYEPRLPALFDCLFAWAAVLNAAGYAWDLFPRVPYYDEFVHACTIFAITLTFGYLTFHSLTAAFAEHRLLFVVAIASVGIAVGALWEVFEWSGGFIGPIPDTIADLAVDAVGALAAALLSALALPPRFDPLVQAQRR